ncbi:phosphate ABC transporter, periplasmic phosphate-binding protein PstS [Halarchaeum acidiphilum MH1-52-1]|uniref:Phosphate ABC transporter, periplasmic phosphate-binding protein PstS n=2 Tax=Halarchaeum acidiphilum TaxID=489138 RepID=U2YTS6_9EURY|nr:phosphate ABC transporter, periplasmic phosphate-binding protein PstS [Halarchaeum acidiphilum MH1-52-1]
MMTHDSAGSSDFVSRRKLLAVTGAAGAVALAGCGGNGGGSESSTSSSTQRATSTSASSGSSSTWDDLLTAGGSSTVYPITSKAASLWNYNAPTSDAEHWPHETYNIDTDLPFADYWASQAGYDADGDKGTLPWHVSIGLSHSGVGLNKVMKGQVDIGDASAPVTAELSGHDDAFYERFVNHVVGVDAMQIIVSQKIYDAGVTQLSADEVRKIYTGDITNWKAVGGPDAEIQVVGRVEGSGTRTIFHERLLGGKEASAVAVHKGENQQVASTVRSSDNAIGYVGYAFVGNGAPAVDMKIDGTVYNQQKGNLGSRDYLLNRDLHCYTYDDTSKMESAFVNMILSDMGQQLFVAANDYITLPDERQKNQRSKLDLS